MIKVTVTRVPADYPAQPPAQSIYHAENIDSAGTCGGAIALLDACDVDRPDRMYVIIWIAPPTGRDTITCEGIDL